MMKMKLTTELAIKLNEKSLEYKGAEYHISTSTFLKGGEPVLAEMTVDAFQGGEWNHELSCVYHENEVIDSRQDEWLLGLI